MRIYGLLSHSTAKLCTAVLSLALTTVQLVAQTVTTIYEYNDINGRYPQLYSFTQARDGQIIGTSGPGSGTVGYVFEVNPDSGRLKVIYEFQTADGYGGVSGVTLARNGKYYGAQTYAFTNNAGNLYSVKSSGAYASLHQFTGAADGAQPYSAPIEGSDGNLYGTSTGAGGMTSPTVYKYTAAGLFSVIYTFTYDGYLPEAPPLETSNGDLLVIGGAGTYGCGAILRMTKAGTVKSTHSFNCAEGGLAPAGQLLEANDGSIYGTTAFGGLYNEGIVYRLDPNTGTSTVLHNFGSGANDGYVPWGGLSQGSDGNLYGTTTLGGTEGCGTIYQLTTSGTYTQLYSFPLGGAGLPRPLAPPYQHTNGKFFGATLYGGSHGFGSLYTLDMGLGPFITFVRPRGKMGATAQILGQNLTGTTSVTFNGVPATSFSVVSDTYMTAVVPAGATTGPVVVTTPTGALTSNVNFRISK